MRLPPGLSATLLSISLPVCVLTHDGSAAAAGPLRVHPTNPRYFSDGSGKAVYLVGSHHWDNFQRWFEGETQQGMKAGHLGRFADYLDVLEKHRHNLVRLWVGDTAWSPITKAPIEPQPYVRTGPDRAADGGLKFDLTRLNQAYFDELRARVIAARDRGIYVSVMLFNSWGISRYHNIPPSTLTWPYHPFNKGNNVNGIDGDPNGDDLGLEYHTLQIPAITRLQETYVRKVVDTVGDLDNVLFEISNESHRASKDWQYHLTRFIKECESARPKRHLVIMTGFTVPTAELFAGPADIVAPNYSKANEFPAATGAKVVIIDSDHNGSYRRDPGFAWRVFLRGAHPIVMDWWSGPEWEDIRRAMGQTRTYAERMNLAAMTPQGTLASSGYCLASPGQEYLVYLPDGGEVSIDLAAVAGTVQAEWFNPRLPQASRGETASGGGRRSFKAPFDGDAVLYLKAP